MKATSLSKFGVPEFDRTVLGRHSSTTRSATAICWRDLASASVCKFEEVLRAIARKEFLPDAPRSAHFVVSEQATGPVVIDEDIPEEVKDEVVGLEVKSESGQHEVEDDEPEVILSSSEDSSDIDIDESSDEEIQESEPTRWSKIRKVQP